MNEQNGRSGPVFSVCADMDGNPTTSLHFLQIFVQIAKEDGRQLVIRKINNSAQGDGVAYYFFAGLPRAASIFC
jgi:hypothetical protein